MTLAVAYADEQLKPAASRLADELSLPLDPLAENTLFLSDEHLYLKMSGFSPVCVDLSWQQWKHRRQEGKKQALIRAGKIKPGMKVLDCTAGWGRDAAIMAAFGAEVTMLERHPVICALLKDALSRQTETDKKHLKLKLIESDAYEYLMTLTPDAFPDLIYIDPMHPERQKAAKVKKEMQMLQALIPPADDLLSLLQLAKQKSARLLLKWPKTGEIPLPASSSICIKTIRYLLYE